MISEAKFILKDKRRSQRAPVPRGTMALLKNGTSSLETFYVRDISGAGVLISNSYTREEYSIDSIISDIYIIIPLKSHMNGGERNKSKCCFLINQGKIVRSSFDHDSFVTTYGISFSDINSYSMKDLTALLEIIPDLIT